MKLSSNAKARIMSWLTNVQNGDKIVFHNGNVIFYNSSGCELDSVSNN